MDTLLEQVEQIVSRNLNVIMRESKKKYVGNYDYKASLGGIWVTSKNGYFFLSTSTQTYLDIDGELLPYTTFESAKLYDRTEKGKLIRNEELKIDGVVLGYLNKIQYLHLPDFLTTQLLLEGIEVKAVTKQVILDFYDDKAKVYLHYNDVFNPYYVFSESFEYNYDYADRLAELIGVFDAYKRGLFPSNDKVSKSLYYLFFPYVSLILYRDLRTTLFPFHIYNLVTKVSQQLSDKGKSVLESYMKDTTTELQELANTLNKKSILI